MQGAALLSCCPRLCRPLIPLFQRPTTFLQLVPPPSPPSPLHRLADNFNGADLRNICTEAGMFAIRDERDYVVQASTQGWLAGWLGICWWFIGSKVALGAALARLHCDSDAATPACHSPRASSSYPASHRAHALLRIELMPCYASSSSPASHRAQALRPCPPACRRRTS